MGLFTSNDSEMEDEEPDGDDLAEYHSLVSKAVAVLDRDVSVVEDRTEALSQQVERLTHENQTLHARVRGLRRLVWGVVVFVIILLAVAVYLAL
jgi:predicted RNase H-like nuclease (RuvC/YqgF family)